MVDNVDPASPPAKTARRRRRGGRSKDPFNVAGRELLVVGWMPGLLVGVSLGWAASKGYIGPLRTSLASLATAAIVVIVLGADAFRQGGERGSATTARRVFQGTAVWVMVAGLMGVVFAAAALPWLGQPESLFGPRPMEAAIVGCVGFVLGGILGAPLVLAVQDVRSRAREEQRLEGVSPPPRDSTGMKARAGEFVVLADDPYRNDTLGRREQVEQFCERVQETATPVVWTVEGAWGTGKTAFSRMCTAVMCNKPDVAEVISVNSLTQSVTGAPLIDLAVAVGRALELAALKQTEELERRRRRSRLADLAAAVSEPAVLLREFGSGDTPAADTVEEMARLVEKYVNSMPGLVVVWIDELDRCPPEYALGMLRAVRSICDQPGIATILTINPHALEEAVVRMHGELDGAERYLRRFIDMRVPLTAPGAGGFEQSENRLGFMRALYNDTSLRRILARAPLARIALESLVGDDSLSLRDLEQIVRHAGIVCAGLPTPPALVEESRLSASARGPAIDPARRAHEAWSDTIETAVALGILRFTAPETYRGATARVWIERKSAYDFFAPTLAEAGGSFRHVAKWPAEELAAAMARVATRQPADGMRLEEIVEIVGLSGAPSRSDRDSAVSDE